MRRRRIITAALLATTVSPLAPPAKRRINFINLTNGIEALPALDHSTQVCRIQSSRCEANDFYGVLQDLDHNLLFHLATGAECRIYDYGSRGTRWPGEVEQKIPRAIWWGLVWVRYALEEVWKIPHTDTPTLRGYNVETLFREKLGRLPKPIYKKLKYYRKFSPSQVDLVGCYLVEGTVNDGRDDVYAEIVEEWLAGATSADEALPEGFNMYRAADWAGVGRGSCAPRVS